MRVVERVSSSAFSPSPLFTHVCGPQVVVNSVDGQPFTGGGAAPPYPGMGGPIPGSLPLHPMGMPLLAGPMGFSPIGSVYEYDDVHLAPPPIVSSSNSSAGEAGLKSDDSAIAALLGIKMKPKEASTPPQHSLMMNPVTSVKVEEEEPATTSPTLVPAAPVASLGSRPLRMGGQMGIPPMPPPGMMFMPVPGQQAPQLAPQLAQHMWFQQQQAMMMQVRRASARMRERGRSLRYLPPRF